MLGGYSREDLVRLLRHSAPVTSLPVTGEYYRHNVLDSPRSCTCGEPYLVSFKQTLFLTRTSGTM
ncbi:hypothetical protein BOTBODRAFT_590029 [Botryobasidium botryosum FD-172 SS1]|uniref:Uncharacterized protein n=1 Tax=Botryobasidium botryosum (strain FD-172 SS1) TaxID=930990 RepID=A0A067LWX6_BOTB1|nr:hypothetical protein BOTBODRAFT_590029 [Botryobasidium botryosum FD-172 SS1]